MGNCCEQQELTRHVLDDNDHVVHVVHRHVLDDNEHEQQGYLQSYHDFCTMGNCCEQQELARHVLEDNDHVVHENYAPAWSPRSEDDVSRCEHQVNLNIYDLNESLIGTNILAYDLLQVGGAFHAGVEIDGTEWSYGSEGIFSGKPKFNECHKYRQTLHIGVVELSSMEIRRLLLRMILTWTGKQYDMLTKNCCSFSDHFCRELGAGPIPHWVNRLARVGSVILTAAGGTENLIGGSARSASAKSGSCVGPALLSVEIDDLEEIAEEIDEALREYCCHFNRLPVSKAPSCPPMTKNLAGLARLRA